MALRSVRLYNGGCLSECAQSHSVASGEISIDPQTSGDCAEVLF